MRKQAFTLVELIVVIAIIAILAAIVAPNAFRAIEKTKIVTAVTDARTITKAAIAFRTDIGLWPGSEWGHMPDDPLSPAQYGEGFVTPPLINTPADPSAAFAANAINNWDGPYLERWKMTPWAMPYMWDWNTPDTNGNGVTPEYVVWFDLAHWPGPYTLDKAVPQPSRVKIDEMVDGVNNFTRGQIIVNVVPFFNTSLEYIVHEGS